MQIDFTTQIWKEGNMYVSFSPELDVSSCGNSIDSARRNLEEAVAGFLETAKERGTLQEIFSIA
jgi:predicted RNase H-like HicB family nuclease